MIVKIGKKLVGNGHPCLITLEPGSTYNNIEEAKKLTKATAEAGADGIKFQTLLTGDADRYMGKKNISFDFTTPTGKKQELMYDAVKRKELSKTEWRELRVLANELNLLFITTASFPETVDFLIDLKVDAIKVSKGDINNVLLIERIAQTQLPVILDGREKFSDVDKAIKICEEQNNNQIIIMHCPSGYPAENSGVHLRAISAIQQKYDYPVGFADHSYGDIMNFAALSLGIKMIEKTITLDKSTEHAEHYMSLEPSELKPFIKNIRAIESAMGDPNILLSSRVSETSRRCFVAKLDIMKGQKINRENLDYQRPESMGIPCSEGYEVLDKVAKIDIQKGTPLQWEMLE